MFKLFRKKLNKKGFTLAELLIVVAIIAVLVAIAIPIFMNSLAKAEKAAEDANIRSLKAAAINKILTEWDSGDKLGQDASGKVAKVWNASGTIENGNITECKVHVSGQSADTVKTVKPTVTKTDMGDHYQYKIENLYIVDTDVTKG